MFKKTILVIFLLLIFSPVIRAEQATQDSNLKLASYWQPIEGDVVQCLLCPRKCVLGSGQRGVCTVRISKDGKLYTLGYGNPVAIHIDPIEKKPFFHVAPGKLVEPRVFEFLGKTRELMYRGDIL